MNEFPHELALGDVYLSPLLPVFSVALLATWLTVSVLNKLRLSPLHHVSIHHLPGPDDAVHAVDECLLDKI